jgi:hypothetical protein
LIKLLPPGLHVILGDVAGGIFTRVFFARDRLLIDQDVLSVGPTPAISDLAQWTRMRHEFWTGFVPGNAGEHVHSRFNLVDNSQKLKDAERVHIWAATGVSEQLFVAFTVYLVKQAGGDVENIALVQFEQMNGMRVTGLGELDEQQLRSAPDPVAMSVDASQMYLMAWHALTSPDPAEINTFTKEHPEANRWLKLAMHLMTRRFPDKKTGLSYWDHALLSRVESRGPGVSQIIGFTMAETYAQGDVVGDWFLFGRLLKLARLPKPLMKLTGDELAIHSTEAEITEFGREVLKGAASNYPANPIEDWAAGTKLSSAEGKVWFNDGGKLVRQGS